jgi:hypothetical protein
MSPNGTWTISINSPQGAQRAAVELVHEGESVTGTARVMGNSMDLMEGRFENGRLTFAIRVSRPVPMRLRFDLSVDGDELTGHVLAGAFGRQPVSGRRES